MSHDAAPRHNSAQGDPADSAATEDQRGAGDAEVSVVMPVHNALPHLDAALASLWAQTLDRFEVVAIDDGSTDGSAQRLAEAARQQPRLRVVCVSHAGATAALIRGVSEARAPLVARMDADDICEPDRLARQVAYLRNHPEVVAVGGALTLIDADGDRLEDHPYPEDHEQILARLEAGRSGLSHPAAMIRAEALRRVGGYDPSYATAQDFDLWLRLASVGRLANLPETLLQYRLHGPSVGGQRRPEQRRAVQRALRAHAQRCGTPLPTDGIPDESAEHLNEADPPSRSPRPSASAWAAGQRLAWARAALRGGEHLTAWKHARGVLRRRPWWVAGWVVAWRAWRRS